MYSSFKPPLPFPRSPHPPSPPSPGEGRGRRCGGLVSRPTRRECLYDGTAGVTIDNRGLVKGAADLSRLRPEIVDLRSESGYRNTSVTGPLRFPVVVPGRAGSSITAKALLSALAHREGAGTNPSRAGMKTACGKSTNLGRNRDSMYLPSFRHF